MIAARQGLVAWLSARELLLLVGLPRAGHLPVHLGAVALLVDFVLATGTLALVAALVTFVQFAVQQLLAFVITLDVLSDAALH